MQALLNVICSVTAFSVLSAVILSIIPCSSKLKKQLTVLSGLICVLILLPISEINLQDFSHNVIEQSEPSTDIDEFMSARINNAVSSEVVNQSRPILEKYGLDNVKVVVNTEILSESGIFVRGVNYIIQGSLSSSDSLEAELCNTTGYVCTVISEEA